MDSEEICRAICRGQATAQCAAICLQYSSLITSKGKCPEAPKVWAKEAKNPIIGWLIKGLEDS